MGEKFPVDFGDYRLLRKIAQGGMAEIFLAHDKKGRICALKRILPHLAHQEGFIRMFIDEARIVSHLDHDNVAGVYAQGKHEGFYFIAMEYVEGHSILALQDRAKKQKMALPRGLLAYIVAELLGGIGYAHAARDAKGRHLEIVHRDVTPQNVMIGYDGLVKLIDFGVAKARARLTQTEAGFTKGKLSYMSPEQARGEPLDGRSDLFSVGIILYEITTGTRLFNKEGPGGILSAIVNDPISPPSYKDRKYPKELEGIVMRALEKDVNRRWQTAEDMRDALLRFARKERPRPGKSRLGALVHDLFGDPKHQSLIAAAAAVHEPTPEKVEAQSVIEGEPVRVRGGTRRPSRNELQSVLDMPKSDETRMMDLISAAVGEEDDEPEPSVQIKREVTSDGTPIVDIPLEHDDIHVPEPKRPARVQLAHALSTFGADAKESWALHTKRYIAGLVAICSVLLIGVLWATGLGGRLVDAIGGAAESARKIKASAGLDPSTKPDAGVEPTVLRVVTVPPGATISVDGLGAGCVTPCDLADLEFQRRLSIELTLAGFRPVTDKVTVYENEGVRELIVTLDRQVGSIRVKSEPSGATVVKDGRRLKGTTPMTIDGVRTDKPITLLVKKRGYKSKTKVVLVRDGETSEQMFTLPINPRMVKPGRVNVTTVPSGCAIDLDGEPIGTSPIRGHTAGSGTYTINARCPNYSPEYSVVTVRSGQTAQVSLTLDPNVFGYLTINALPPKGTKILLNGRAVSSVQFRKVIPGRHVVEVVNERLGRTKKTVVNVRPEKTVTRTINLLN